jgi:HK97 family phage portal protein
MSILDKFFNIKKKNDVLTLFDKFGTHQDNLIENSYERNVDAYAVVKKISDIFSSTPWLVEQKVDGEWQIAEENTVQDLIENPNNQKGYTWNDIDEQMITYLLCSGNAYLRGEMLNGKIEEVDVLPSNHIEIETNPDFFLPNLRYKFDIDNTKRTYSKDDIEHIKLFNPNYNSVEDSYEGLSVFQVAAKAVQVGNDRWDASAHLFQNRGMSGLITDQSERPMLADEAAKVQKSFKQSVSGTNKFGGVKVTNKDLKYISMSMSSTDLQLIEQGTVPLRAICNVLGLDSSLFNDPANKTFNNRLEAEKAMYTNVIIPLAARISAAHNNYIVRNHYPEGNYRMRKDYSKVEALQKDKKQEAQKDKIVMDGINVILKMEIDMDTKVLLIKENYNVSEEIINSLKNTKIITDEPISD